MRITLEEDIQESLPTVELAADSSKGLYKAALLVMTGLIIAATFFVTLFVDHPASGAFAYEHSAIIGPLDEFGQHVANVDPLPNKAADNVQVIYDVNALTIKRLGEKNAQEKAKAAEREAEEKAAAEEAAKEAEAEKAAEEEAAARQAAVEAEAARQAKAKQDAEIALQREVEAAQQRAEAEAQAQAPDEAAAELRRAIAQQQQEAEAKARAQAEANYQYSLTHPKNGQYTQAIAIAGEVITWVYERTICPDDTAGAWRGDGYVNDGEGTYFVGHNPGVFHGLIDNNIGIGDTISVWDSNGNGRAYTIDDVFIIPAGTLYDEELQNRTTFSGGESITLQTCIDSGKRYKVFVAH